MVKERLEADLKLVAWELTRTCNLSCIYCRAAAENKRFSDELTTGECFELIDDISSFSNPVVILTGGEILLRSDILDICSYGTKRGLRMVASTNGVLLTKETALHLKESGVKRMSISIDGKDELAHDSIRKVEGAFKGAMNAVKILKSLDIPVQINTTISRKNYEELPDILKIAEGLKVNSFHVFFLVPTGRASYLKNEDLSPKMYEQVLTWLAHKAAVSPIPIKTTCAPHFYRITRQQKVTLKNIYTGRPESLDSFTPLETKDKTARNKMSLTGFTRGCLAGIGFCFISHTGNVCPCGYFDRSCGNIREQKFSTIWQESELFSDLRDLDKYKGKCGSCEFIKICGGCRARALYKSGNYMDEEPYCVYEPR